MVSRAVHWEEGLFLTPQHLQAADRHTRRNLREVEDWFHPFNWGLRSVRFDPLVTNYVVTLRSCEARFKDGTRLAVGDGLDVPPLSINLRSALQGSAETVVSLALPSFRLGVKNVEEAASDHGARFWVDVHECDDENTGAQPTEVRFRRPRARLLHSGEAASGYETLPLLRVTRSSLDGSVPQFDLATVPPLLSLDAWSWLRDEVQSLSHQIRGKLEQLADQAVDREITFRGQDAGDAERLLKLAALNEVDPPFHALAFTPGFTPLAVYVELCRIIGRLSLFLPDRRPPAVPPYDHENLGGCFMDLIEKIKLALRGVEPTTYVASPFTRVASHLQTTVEEEWLQPSHQMLLGVETELSEEECDRLLRDEELDRSIGSAAQVETLFARRFPGLTLTATRAPSMLPTRRGVVYFAFGRDNPKVWAGVLADRSLAIRFNPDQAPFQNEEVVRVTTPDGKATNLRFVLYVVPRR